MFAGYVKTSLRSALLVAVLVAAPSAAMGQTATTPDPIEQSLPEGAQPPTPAPPVVRDEADPPDSGAAGDMVEPSPSASETLAPSISPSSGDLQTVECQDGSAGPFPCENVDLESMVPLPAAGVGSGNDVWGWTDPQTDREYALVGSALATTFVDVTDPQDPRTVGFLPTAQDAPPDFVLWRDIKVDGNWAFIVSEISGHGMQVFDLTRLRDPGPVAQIFTADALYRGADDEGLELGNAHNIAINEATDFAYIVGSNTCVTSGPEGQNGGLHMVDISDPENPEFAGCARVTDPPQHNYVHDVQCVIYSGPDADYRGREICFGSNEEVVTVYDVTDKDDPVVISQWGYPQASYTHQGWLTPDQRFFLFGDEGDETSGTVDNTTTYIMDALDLDRPRVPQPFFHETRSIDHNLYIRGDLVFQSNYGAGLRILQYTNTSLGNGELNEVGYFDIRPGFDEPEFVGTWSNYPYFESGIVVMTALEEGSTVLYVLRPTGEADPTSGGGGTGGGGTGGGTGGGGTGGGGGSGGGGQPPAGGGATGPPGGGVLAATGAAVLIFVLLGLALIAVGAVATNSVPKDGRPQKIHFQDRPPI